MKLYLSILFLISGINGIAQKSNSFYPGYIIYEGLDTLNTKIAFRGYIIEASDLFRQVSFYDRSGRIDTVVAGKKVTGFGFSVDTIQYHFIEITVGSEFPDSGKFFGWKVVGGPTKLIFYAYNGSRMGSNPGTKGPEFIDYSQQYHAFFLQKENGKLFRPESKFGLNAATTIYYNKKWLKEFFKDDKTLVEKIGKEIGTEDLETMVKEYNNWLLEQRSN
jgi:hypothetical protein